MLLILNLINLCHNKISNLSPTLFQSTKDLKLIEQLIDTMDAEFMFWIENRTTIVTIKDEEFLMAHYTSNVSFPRPGKNVHTAKLTFQWLQDILHG